MPRLLIPLAQKPGHLPLGRERFESSRFTWWILSMGGLLRIIFYFLSDNNGTDALDRAALAAKWVKHPNWDLAFGAPWPPLHFWLMGTAALALGNVDFASRLLSLLTGIVSLWLVWKLARGFYGQSAADFSVLAFAIYTLQIGYSTTSSSEAPYLFFVLAGLCAFLSYERSGHLSWIALSGICFTFGSAIRYEAWVVAFCVGLILLVPAWRTAELTFWRSDHLQSLALFTVTAGSWPVFWLGYSWLKWKHPLYFVAMNHTNVAEALALNPSSGLYRLAVFPVSLFLTLSPLVFGAALCALWRAAHGRIGWQIAVVVIGVALVQFYQIISGGVMAFARYSITLGTLLAIMSGYGLESLRQRYFANATRAFRTAVLITLLLNLGIILTLSETRWRYSEKFGSISPRVRFPHYIQDLGKALRHRLGPSDAVVIDNYNAQTNLIEAVSGFPLLTPDRVFDAAAEHQDLQSELQSFIATKRPKYLVYSDRGTLQPFFALPYRCQSTPVISEGIEFQCLFATELYSLYEIHYLSS